MNEDKQAAGEQPAMLPIDVLIIDEDQAYAKACSQLLKKSGYRTSIAENGLQGMQMVLSEKPSVVLLDLRLTGINGTGAIGRNVKKEPFAVPIVITGQATVDSAIEATKLGAFDFLTKPYEPNKLLEMVRRCLNLSTQRGEAKKSKASAVEQPHPSDKYDLLLRGLDVLGEAYSMGMGKRQFLDELASIESEAKSQAENLGQVKNKGRAILDIRNEFLEADAIMRKHDFQKNALIQILLDVQATFHRLPRHIINWISGRLSIPLSETYELAAFYEAFTLEPRGRHIVRVCNGTACHVRGASELQKRIETALGIQSGQTDSRQQFTLETVNCPGCCALAPVVQIGSEYYRDPSQNQLKQVFKSLAKEEA
jgi:NADH-quinone oxidoreductase subunit E